MLCQAGAVTIASFIFMRETSAVTILRRKATRLSKRTGNPNLRAAGDRQTPIPHLVLHTISRPVRFLLVSPILCLIALHVAFNFGVTMLLFATFPTVFEDTYGWSVGISGLAYIGIGVGCAIGIFIFGKFSDRMLRGNGGPYNPERRLILMMYVSPLLPIGLFLYAWTTESKVHWIVPIVGTAIGGPGVVVLISSSQTYTIDIFGPRAAASAMAGINLLRNLLGAFLPLAAPRLYTNLHMGWGNSVLAFIAMAFIPVPFWLYRHGRWLREKFPGGHRPSFILFLPMRIPFLPVVTGYRVSRLYTGISCWWWCPWFSSFLGNVTTAEWPPSSTNSIILNWMLFNTARQASFPLKKRLDLLTRA